MRIKWGSYREYEGPYTLGEIPYILPDKPTFEHKCIKVITATEGGHYDSINRYDRCLDTQGVIQWCNAYPQASVDAIYKKICLEYPEALFPVNDFLKRYKYVFDCGQGMFIKTNTGQKVDTVEEQNKLYFNNPNGNLKGSFDSKNRQYAVEFTEAAQKVWRYPKARQVQSTFTLDRLEKWFVLNTLKIIYTSAPDTPYGQAFKAIFLSFATNNPTYATNALNQALKSMEGRFEIYSPDWLTWVIKYLIFETPVAIYPSRYKRIVSVVESLFNVDLKESSELVHKKYTELKNSHAHVNVVELQSALSTLGYDLGPRGVDGVFGKKTRQAVIDFARSEDKLIPINGNPSPEIIKALEQKLNRHLSESLGI